MDALELTSADQQKLLRRYDDYYKTVQAILEEMGERVSMKRGQLAFGVLGIDMLLMRANPRLKHAAYSYLYFTDRRKGSTLFEAWYRDHKKKNAQPSTTFSTVVDALAKSRFSAFEIERVHDGLGVNARDVLTGDRHLIVDRLMSQNWGTGMQFATRIAILPEFTMSLCEPLESAVKPGQDFTGGQLSEREQAKIQTVVIEMFQDALLSC